MSTHAPKRGPASICRQGHTLAGGNLLMDGTSRRCRCCRLAYFQRDKRPYQPPSGKLRAATIKKIVSALVEGRTFNSICGRQGDRKISGTKLIDSTRLTAFVRANPELGAWMKARSAENLAARRAKPAAPGRSNLRKPALAGTIAGAPNGGFAVIDAAVSRQLPRHIRDDVIGSVTLEVLEGRLSLCDLAKAVKQRQRQLYSETNYGPISLDAPAYRDGAVPLVETISEGIWQ